ncbi:MAG TPA: hypothetical protein VGX23_04130 [Actinocrinis sp.]|nr:hypothetical protein [Actinocrinis sp.]
MPDSIKKLREPAALAAVAFVGLSLLSGVIALLFSSGGIPFSDRSLETGGRFLDFDVALGLAIGVYLANHAGPAPLAKARLITLVALVEAAVAVVFGVVTMLAAFGADDTQGSDKFASFLAALGALAAVAVAAWYTWLTWQQHAATAAPAPAPAGQQAWAGGYASQSQPQYGQPQPGQYPGPGQSGQYPGQPQQPAGGQQVPPPGGFGWTPQHQPQQPPLPPAQAADRTQMLPPVTGAPAGFAPDPQPWNPSAPQPGQSQAQLPAQPQELPPPPPPHSGPFSVGDWRSDS